MKTRIVWAIIMIILAYLLIAVANDIVFTIMVAFISLIAGNELINTQKRVPFIIRMEMYLFLIFTCLYSYFWGMLDAHYFIIMFLVLVITVVLYQNLEKFNFTDISVIFTMTIYLVLGFNSLVNIKINFSLLVFFYPILIAVIADTFGYFGGMLFGKHKLIEKISPKKTWEGVISATIFASLFSYFYLQNFDFNKKEIIIITLIVVILSQIGDLVASTIKRTFAIKDYSNLIPGHGGILDRFDSILFNFIVISVIFIYI
ncbi:MAG: phosphatidate cytidylyltransferase [Bacilli bacterium]